MRITDEPQPHQTAYIGQTARLDIPLRSVTALRRIAEELRGLATNLEYLSRRTGENAGPVLFEARCEIRRANKRIEAVRGRGRPVAEPPKQKPFKHPNDY
jgi:hypothetical protein